LGYIRSDECEVIEKRRDNLAIVAISDTADQKLELLFIGSWRHLEVSRSCNGFSTISRWLGRWERGDEGGRSEGEG